MRNKFLCFALVFVLAAGSSWAQFWKNYSDKDRESMAQAYWLAGKQYQAAGKTEKGAELMRLARAMDPKLDPASIKERDVPSVAELLARDSKEGQAPLPTSRKPEPAAATAQAAPTRVAEASKAIVDAFGACLGDLLKKDTDSAVAYMADNVTLLRLRQSVTKMELKTTLDGSLENADLGGMQAGEAVDVDSEFVEKVQSPVDGVGGNVFTLSVHARKDLTAALPFWRTWQRYYFMNDDGRWKIFALF